MTQQAIQATLWPGEEREARRMGGFGERMQREREMRSITLEEIAESTKIGCRMLRALEEEDFDKLPGGIFNKGFVRAYAKFLGIDEEQAVVDFQAAFLEKQQKQSTNGSNGLHHGDVLASMDTAPYAEPAAQPDQAAGFMRAAVIIVCLLGLGGLAWKFFPRKAAPDSPPITVAQPNPVQAAPPLTPAATPADTAAKTPEVVAPSTTPQKAADSALTAAPASSEPAAAAETGRFRLRIYAKETSWVQITADGKLLMRGELSPSGTRSFQANKEMVVTLGNAPGVELSYNGKPLPQFPADPKTRTLTFTPEGLQQ